MRWMRWAVVSPRILTCLRRLDEHTIADTFRGHAAYKPGYTCYANAMILAFGLTSNVPVYTVKVHTKFPSQQLAVQMNYVLFVAISVNFDLC